MNERLGFSQLVLDLNENNQRRLSENLLEEEKLGDKSGGC
jgi:hypothetical protein